MRNAQDDARSGTEKPLVSILMPSYNSVDFLADAVDSLHRQSYDCWELLVQDAGSKDGTLEALRDFANDDPRIRVEVEPDNGQSDALNRALARAAGDYVGCLNADDLVLAGALAAVAQASLTGAHVIYGDWRLVDKRGLTLRDYRVGDWSWDKFYRDGCYIFSGAIFVSRRHLQMMGGWNGALHYCMDLDLALRLNDVRTVHTGSALAALRWHSQSKSGSAGWRFVREAFAVRQAHANNVTGRIRGAVASAKMAVSTATTDIRFSSAYSRLRSTKTF